MSENGNHRNGKFMKPVKGEAGSRRREIAGERLKLARQYFDLTQEEVSLLLDEKFPEMEWKQENISSFERGLDFKDYRDRVNQISVVLNLPVEYFLPKEHQTIQQVGVTKEEKEFLFQMRSGDFLTILRFALDQHERELFGDVTEEKPTEEFEKE